MDLSSFVDEIKDFVDEDGWGYLIIKHMDFRKLKIIGIELIDRQFGLWSYG